MGRSNVMDFDDMLSLVNAALRDPEVARIYGRRYRHLLVDEFQDTSAAQYHFVRAITHAGVRRPPRCSCGSSTLPAVTHTPSVA